MALPLAVWGPPVRLALAGSRQWVAPAVRAAQACRPTQRPPAPRQASALSAGRVALPVGVAKAALFAVGAPVLGRAAWKERSDSENSKKPPCRIGPQEGYPVRSYGFT